MSIAPKEHDFSDQRSKLVTLVKTKVSEMAMTVEQTLAVASLVGSDPMIECLIRVDQQSWLALQDTFSAYSKEDRLKKFLSVSEQIRLDPIVKGKYHSAYSS